MGQAILESYSRIIESLAFTVLSRIDDVMHADTLAKEPSITEQHVSPVTQPDKSPSVSDESEKSNPSSTPTSKTTLLDFMGWGLDQEESTDAKKDLQSDVLTKDLSKPVDTVQKKMSYLERIGDTRSPRSRH